MSGALRRRWAALVALCGRREPAHGLALFRIAVGLSMLYALISMAWSGLDQVFWVDTADGGMFDHRPDHWLLAALGGRTAAVIGGLVPVGIGLAVCVTLGLGGRPVLLCAGQVYQALVRAGPLVTGGYDLLIGDALWLLLLAGASRSLSLDARIRRGTWAPAIDIAAWPRYLAIFQILTVYTTTGLHKQGPPWTPIGGFSALYWVFQEPTWRRFDLSFTASVYPLTQIATAVTWLWEISALLLLVFYYYRETAERPGRIRAWMQRRDLRVAFVAIGVPLHLGILILLNVGPFSLISLAYYLCLWHPDELARGGRRLLRVTPAVDKGGAAPAADGGPRP
ncbi:MAG: hypothetical protein R3B09_01950 [Nannocystaceae bacterium]